MSVLIEPFQSDIGGGNLSAEIRYMQMINVNSTVGYGSKRPPGQNDAMNNVQHINTER